MPNFKVRIDACFNFDIEADDEDEAKQKAEDEFDPGDGYSHITETLVFDE